MIIGITGTDGAGKGTVVEYLVKNRGFKLYHARALFLEELERRGMPTDRAHLRLMGNEMRKQHGNDFIASSFLKRAKESGDEQVIIDSIRALAEAETLKKGGGILLALDADQHIRYERILKRASSSDSVTFAEFVAQEEIEKNDPDPNGMQKQQVMDMADHTIHNNKDTDALYEEVEKFLNNFS